MKPALPEPGACNGTALRKAMRRVSQLYDSVLEPSGLRGTQRSILIHIARATGDSASGGPSMSELALALVLDRGALAHNLKPLERDGLVEILPDPSDKRARIVRLTAMGESRLAQSMVLWAEAQERFERAFGPQEAEMLRHALARIAAPEFAQAFRQD